MEQLTKLTDRDLVAAYANNNNEAFDVLLQRHQQKVYSYILHIVKNKDAPTTFSGDFRQGNHDNQTGTVYGTRKISDGSHVSPTIS